MKINICFILHKYRGNNVNGSKIYFVGNTNKIGLIFDPTKQEQANNAGQTKIGCSNKCFNGFFSSIDFKKNNLLSVFLTKHHNIL